MCRAMEIPSPCRPAPVIAASPLATICWWQVRIRPSNRDEPKHRHLGTLRRTAAERVSLTSVLLSGAASISTCGLHPSRRCDRCDASEAASSCSDRSLPALAPDHHYGYAVKPDDSSIRVPPSVTDRNSALSRPASALSKCFPNELPDVSVRSGGTPCPLS